MQRDHWIFGAGFVIHRVRAYFSHCPFSRRICPGMWVAEREVWLVISRMLWAFKMEALPQEPIDLKEYDGLSGRSPMPFRINTIPRDCHVAAVLGI
jgi:Cytochrome P450